MNFKKISLVIPFYNESKKIVKSTRNILKQVDRPDEVIFVNNNSNDNSELKLRLFLKNFNNINNKNKIKIVKNKKKQYPSSAKNIGIKLASHKNVAFFDIGLSINNYFISNLKKKISPNEREYIQGCYFFKSKNSLDRAYLIQTYGMNRLGGCIPSSCFKKSLFNKIGYFQNFRSGYDRVFLNNLKLKKFPSKINFKSPVNYLDNISGSSLAKIFRKIFYYSYSTVGLKNYHIDKTYIFLFILFMMISSIGYMSQFLIIYLFFRCIFIPIKKNFKSKIKKLEINDFIMVPIIGILIDVARVFGFLSGYIKRLI